jgi:hypothetical protein
VAQDLRQLGLAELASSASAMRQLGELDLLDRHPARRPAPPVLSALPVFLVTF